MFDYLEQKQRIERRRKRDQTQPKHTIHFIWVAIIYTMEARSRASERADVIEKEYQ